MKSLRNAPHCRFGKSPRAGFTLAEIAMALAVVSLGVVTLFLMVPQGIRTQTQVRYKLIAAAKAQEVINLLRQNQPGLGFDARDQDKEGVFPWDTRTTYKAMAPDLEPMLESVRGTIKPLPEVIARRLVSDDDEIRTLINNGGRLYYFYPGLPAQGVESPRSSPMDINWIDGSRKLVMGVVGAPQQNSILYHPSVKIGPYQDFYPSPPAHGRQSIMENDAYDGDMFNHPNRRTWWGNISYDSLARDPNIQPVHNAMIAYMNAVGQRGSAAKVGSGSPSTANAYMQAALEYAVTNGFKMGSGDDFDLMLLAHNLDLYEKSPRPIEGHLAPTSWPPVSYSIPSDPPLNFGITAESVGLTTGDPDSDIWDAYCQTWPPRYYTFVRQHSTANNWQKVLAMRYLGHAAMSIMQHRTADLEGASPSGLTFNVPNPNYDSSEPITPANLNTFSGTIYLETIRSWHETAVQMGIHHADQAGPYHWGAPRPLNRQVMMDHPLVQLDMQSPVISREFAFQATTGDSNTRYPRGYSSSAGINWPPQVNSGVVTRQQWKAVYPQAIATPGLSDRPWMYPGRVLDQNNDGFLDHNDYNIPDSSSLSADSALGNPQGFSLSAPFQPQERARQLVFWSVDWQSYVDFESAPSASIDSSRYPLAAPAPNHVSPMVDPMAMSNPYLTNTDYRRQLNGVIGVSALANGVRNPELISLFTAPSRQWDSSTNNFSTDYTTDWYENSNVTNIGELQNEIPIMSEFNVWLDRYYSSVNESLWGSPGVRMIDLRSETSQNMPTSVRNQFYGHDSNLFNMMIFLGRYGANRNGVFDSEWVNWRQTFGQSAGSSYKNVAQVDRGSIPVSVQLRAITVARFNFYDPRVSGGLFR